MIREVAPMIKCHSLKDSGFLLKKGLEFNNVPQGK